MVPRPLLILCLTVERNGTTTYIGTSTSQAFSGFNFGDTYTVTEATTTASQFYGVALDPSCSGQILSAGGVTCDITNTYKAPSLAIAPGTISDAPLGEPYSADLTARRTPSARSRGPSRPAPCRWDFRSAHPLRQPIRSRVRRRSSARMTSPSVSDGFSSSTQEYTDETSAAPAIRADPSKPAGRDAGRLYDQTVTGGVPRRGCGFEDSSAAGCQTGLKVATSSGFMTISGIPNAAGNYSFTIHAESISTSSHRLGRL